jgi:hypothetical protein
MTVAFHGFPGEDVKVHHPVLSSPIIGEVACRIADIALVKLQDHPQFVNHTFQIAVSQMVLFYPESATHLR